MFGRLNKDQDNLIYETETNWNSKICVSFPGQQEAEYQRAMQRRAIRDAKMKQVKPVVDDSLTLQGKKDKIKSNLQRLAELGKVDPQNRYQDLINDIAKVEGPGARRRAAAPQRCRPPLCNWRVTCVTGHQEPEAIPPASESWAGEAPADKHRPQQQEEVL